MTRLLTVTILIFTLLPAAAGETAPRLRRDNQATPINGRLTDVFLDDVDEGFFILSFERNGKTEYISCPCTNAIQSVRYFQQQLGRSFAATCSVTSTDFTYNRRMLKTLLTIGDTRHISFTSTPVGDPFDIPFLSEAPPELNDIATCGPRKINGTVVARWKGNLFLVRQPNGETVQVRLRIQDPPDIFQSVDVVGTVNTDLYRYNLSQAQWRPSTVPAIRELAPRAVPLQHLFKAYDRPMSVISAERLGEVIRIHGTLKSSFADDGGPKQLLVGNGDLKISIDCSMVSDNLERLCEGCEVSVAGACIMESENWHADSGFPKVSGLFLVPRTAADVKVLRQPPWWTPTRFAAVVIGLLALLAAILVWNATLRALVARKSRALLREQALKLSETLKIDERTRLAAELHDFHSQNLTAIAYEVSSARNACRDDPQKAEAILTTAAQMLKSCRTELRRCLWDLRNDALNKSDFAAAIRETVLPVAREAKVSVRFAGHRAQISDSTAYALLSILRELTANAVVHGHATSVRIAGEQLPQTIRFSVQDDGCGFDPVSRQGQNEGHFGLDGIRERLNRLGGTLDIRSRPGEGTYVRLTINSIKQDTI